MTISRRRNHIPQYGCLEALGANEFDDFTEQAIGHVQAVWQAMLHKSAGFPLGHDGYLKLCSLSRPRAQVDYILVDEAQDLNPVLLGVLRRIQFRYTDITIPVLYFLELRDSISGGAKTLRTIQ
jgi:hypothetical protein